MESAIPEEISPVEAKELTLLDKSIELAVGLVIDLSGSEQYLAHWATKQPGRNANVRVTIFGETKEFTFSDFFTRLGFQEPPKEG